MMNHPPAKSDVEKVRNLSKEGFGVLLTKAEQSNGLGTVGVRNKNELIVGVADGVNGGAGEGLGNMLGTESSG